MTWTTAMYGLFAMTLVFAVAALFRRRSATAPRPIRDYLLAANELPDLRVLNLLWAASFSVNGMVYQTYLGYKIGLWALLTQFAWALSFFWLAKYVSQVRRADSMHSALGAHHHRSLRPVAAIFSILSAMALVGWEFNVLQSTFRELVPSPVPAAADQGSLIAVGIVFSCLLYTAIGGMRANAVADLAQSFFKLLGFGLLIALLYANFGKYGTAPFSNLPDFNQAILVLTVGGLITNLAFSLTWQLTDMSTWQNVISGSAKTDTEGSASVLRRGGAMTFVAPGILGTLLGILLSPVVDINEGNSIAKAIETLHPLSSESAMLIFLAIAACAMSMIDGLLLVSGYALVVDILHRNSSLNSLDENPDQAFKTLGFTRLSFVLLATFGMVGISTLMEWLGLAEFMILYVVVLPAMAIFGPVLFLLIGCHARTSLISVVPFLAIAVGISYILEGGEFSQWAGTATMIVSALASAAIWLFSVRVKS